MDEWDERGGMRRWVMVFQMQRNAGSEAQGQGTPQEDSAPHTPAS